MRMEIPEASGACVYLLRCADGSLYCGWTADLRRRVQKHSLGQGARYTRARLPVELVYFESCADRHEAMCREWEIKQMTRAEKLELLEKKQN